MKSKKRMVVYDDHILVDIDLIFETIRENNGDWKKVEAEMKELMANLQEMVGGSE